MALLGGNCFKVQEVFHLNLTSVQCQLLRSSAVFGEWVKVTKKKRVGQEFKKKNCQPCPFPMIHNISANFDNSLKYTVFEEKKKNVCLISLIVESLMKGCVPETQIIYLFHSWLAIFFKNPTWPRHKYN